MDHKKKALIQYLVSRYSNRLITEEEYGQLVNLIKEPEADEELKALLAALWTDMERKDIPAAASTKKKHFRSFISAAAIVLLCITIGAVWYRAHEKRADAVTVKAAPADILPGGNKAVLTLSGGQQIVLTTAGNGQLATQGGVVIKKTADGKVLYSRVDNGAKETSGQAVYNTLTTPRGGRYEATLADGTHFVLDASSSIRYPVSFTGRQRKVEITGQVYFDVVHNSARPFIVSAGGLAIEDIGTQFNVNAYDDEPLVRTTLIEGSVRVSKNGQSALLRPGQQAITGPAAEGITVKHADAADAVAWKNGQTSFKNEGIQEIMRQVARWYDVEVVYQGEIPAMRFTGGIPRNATLSGVLKVLELNNIHFKVAGRKITITP